MNVLIVAEYLDNIKNPDTYNSRFLTIADLLVSNGHTVRIVTTDFIHSAKKHIHNVKNYKNCELITLHEPGYQKNISVKRFRSHNILSKNLKKWLSTIEKPDAIYCAVPSLDFAYEAAKFALNNGVKFVLDIQDLWPEAFEMVLNVPFVTKLLFAPLRIKANYIYKASSRVLAVSQTYINRAGWVNKSANPEDAVFLGTQLSRFDSYKSNPSALEKDSDEIWLGYVGTLGNSYDLKTVMDSMELLKGKSYYNKLKFIVVGDGPLRQEFEDYAKEKNLNVHFTGMLPYPQMVATLCKCDIAINPIRKKSAGSIINKHGDYAAAGIAVVNTQESPEYRLLVEKYGMGVNCNCEDAVDMADKIQPLLESEHLRVKMGKQARKCAEELFDRKKTYTRIIDAIEN